MPTDTSERGLERLICTALTGSPCGPGDAAEGAVHERPATTHWIVGEGQARTVADVVERTYAWNERKKQFSRRQLESAGDVLSRKRWIKKFDLSGTPRIPRRVNAEVLNG